MEVLIGFLGGEIGGFPGRERVAVVTDRTGDSDSFGIV